MKFDINVNVYFHDDEKIMETLDKILRKQDKLMAASADVLAYAQRINTVTDNIAADIERILASQELTPEAKEAMDAVVARLEGVASVVPETPEGPVEPPVEG